MHRRLQIYISVCMHMSCVYHNVELEMTHNKMEKLACCNDTRSACNYTAGSTKLCVLKSCRGLGCGIRDKQGSY